jgi:hypothetical protein
MLDGDVTDAAIAVQLDRGVLVKVSGLCRRGGARLEVERVRLNHQIRN